MDSPLLMNLTFLIQSATIIMVYHDNKYGKCAFPLYLLFTAISLAWFGDKSIWFVITTAITLIVYNVLFNFKSTFKSVRALITYVEQKLSKKA